MKEKISEIIDVELSAISGIGNSDKSTVSITSDLGRAVIRNVALKYAAIEVEKRIAERMPTVDDAENAQLTYEHNQTDCLDRFSYIHCYRDFMAGIEWLRSRMTEQNNSVEGKK